MDNRNMLDKIQKLAESYVPEWTFDQSNPDMGVALAEVFEMMQGKTEEKYRNLMNKYQRDFFNCINTSMKKAAPASGYVVFGLPDTETEGVEVPRGTALTTDVTDEYGERIPIETTADLYVIPDNLETIYEYSEEDDYIGVLYEQGEFKGFSLFSEAGTNIQEHILYLSHPDIFFIRQYAGIRLTLLGPGEERLEDRILEALCDPCKASFFYLTKEEEKIIEVPFKQVRKEGNSLVMEKKSGDIPIEAVELSGETSYWIGLRILQKKAFEGLAIGRIYLSSVCGEVFPEVQYANGDEKRGGGFYPFGEQLLSFREFYISSEEVFSKRGAEIELSFERELRRTPVQIIDKNEEKRWKLVMPKETMVKEKEYEISIEDVVWEYFNGLGWTNLFDNNEYSDIFSNTDGGLRRSRSMSFKCPMDIAPVLVNSQESYFIRARIRKVNNEYKTNGVYLLPYIHGTRLKYEYRDNCFEPGCLYLKNNAMGQLRYPSECFGKMKSISPIQLFGERDHAVYLGLNKIYTNGPIRVLWVMENDYELNSSGLSWEYFSKGSWRPLNVADETGSFRRTGLTSFSGMQDPEKKLLFNRNLYWIRVSDRNNIFNKNNKTKLSVSGMWMNGTSVLTVRRGIVENLTMEGYEENKEFQLLNRNIQRLEVWVLEKNIFSSAKYEELRNNGLIESIRDIDGTIKENWIKWTETDNFRFHKPNDRVYMLDANEGRLIFGGGEHGAIPAPDIVDGIKVKYSIGGGSRCNLLPGQINGLELSAGFINMVTNPLPLSGGYGRESVNEAILRAGRERRHQFRLTSESDLEALAFEATRSIEKAHCFSCRDIDGKEKPGAATLVILKKDYRAGGRFFQDIRNQIYDYMKDKLPVAMDREEALFIREPVLVEIRLKIVAVCKDDRDVFLVKRRIENCINRFLDPISGNFDGRGWDIGKIPDNIQLETIVKSVKGLSELKSLVLFASPLSESCDGRLLSDDIRKHPYILPVSGEHQILVQS